MLILTVNGEARTLPGPLTLAELLERLGDGRRLAHHVDVRIRGQQVAQLVARRRLVVDDRHLHAAGTSRRTIVPKPPDFRRTPSP